MITLVMATIREASRWLRGKIDPPDDPPPSETVKWLEEVRYKAIAERRKMRRDWLEDTLVYQDEGREDAP